MPGFRRSAKIMFLDRATCDANHRRFVQRVVEKEKVWYLSHPDGVANSVSNDDDCLLYTSDAADE